MKNNNIAIYSLSVVVLLCTVHAFFPSDNKFVMTVMMVVICVFALLAVGFAVADLCAYFNGKCVLSSKCASDGDAADKELQSKKAALENLKEEISDFQRVKRSLEKEIADLKAQRSYHVKDLSERLKTDLDQFRDLNESLAELRELLGGAKSETKL